MVKPSSSLPPGYKYWAFISYSHRDEKWATWLQKELETLAIPKTLVGTPKEYGKVPGSLYPVFLDREELAAETNLPDRIKAALQQSLSLIVVCSPQSARSYWVNLEIAKFKALGREDRVICLIVDGEPNASKKPKSGLQECFPEALLYRLNSKGQLVEGQAEPIAADVRPNKDGKRNALLKVVAGMLQVGFGDLKQRDHERQMRRLWIGGGVLLLLVFIFAGIAGFATLQWQRAEEQKKLAFSGDLGSQAISLIGETYDRALLVSLEALNVAPTFRAKSALYRSLLAQPYLQRYLRGHIRQVAPGAKPRRRQAVSFDPSGRRVAAIGGWKRNYVGLFDIDAGRSLGETFSTDDAQAAAIAFSQNGKYLAAANNKGRAFIWEVATRNEVPSQFLNCENEKWSSGTIFFAGNNDHVGLYCDASDPPTITLLHVPDGKLVKKIPLDKDVFDIAPSQDGTLLAVEYDTKVDIFGLFDNRKIILTDPRLSSGPIAWSLDGNTIAAGGGDNDNVLLWDVNSSDRAARLLSATGVDGANRIAFSADGKRLAVGGDGDAVIVWDLESENKDELYHQSTAIWAGIDWLEFSPQGNQLITYGKDDAVILWNLDKPHSLGEKFSLPLSKVTFMEYGSNGHLLFVGDVEKTVRVVDWTSRQTRVLQGIIPEDTKVLALDEKGRQLALSDSKDRIHVFDVATGRETHLISAADIHGVSSLSFGPDGSQFAIGNDKGEIIMHDIEASKVLGTPLAEHHSSIRDMRFSADGLLFASLDDDGRVILWDTEHLHPLDFQLEVEMMNGNLAFNTNGTELAAGGSESFSIWATGTGEKIKTMNTGSAFGAPVIVDFSRDGAFFAWARYGTGDGYVHGGVAVEHSTGRESLGPALVYKDMEVESIKFSPDSRTIAALTQDQRIVLWNFDLAFWRERACAIANRNLTTEEWQQFFSYTPYRPTCPDVPTTE